MSDPSPLHRPTFDEVSDPARRRWLRGTLASALASAFTPAGLASLAGCAAASGAGGGSALGFAPVPPSAGDRVVVPEGYTAQVIARWGEPVGIAGAMPDWRPDAATTAAEQALQLGMHHDGLQFVPLDGGSSRRGLLVVNHEYTDEGLLHAVGAAAGTERVRKSQAAHGMSVVEVERGGDGAWRLVRPSAYARRITATTPVDLSGPAAGHPLLRTAADPGGRRVLGTMANCGLGITPWGTVLSGEENFHEYFVTADQPTAHERRWGLTTASWARWHEHDPRFDTVRHPNEPNRYGWIVEVDPMDPQRPPVKRTALGRACHEGATVALAADGRAVVYMGEDARFECLYRFVSRDPVRPAGNGLSAAQANADLLDHGQLWVARFDAGGHGHWLPLVHGAGPLTAARGYADTGDVLVKARQASDAVGGTPLDRPEWIALHSRGDVVCVALTNNAERGTPGRPGVDAANPRPRNEWGQIVRWRPAGGDHAADRFEWDHLLLAGDTAGAAAGNPRGDAFACPDTIAFDTRGVLWIATDVACDRLLRGEMARYGNNQLLACDPAGGDVRRFLTGPVGCEITGASWAPDGRTLFVDVQHPGEAPDLVTDPAAPRRWSNWPDFLPGGRPRSATLAIRRDDGGVIGGVR